MRRIARRVFAKRRMALKVGSAKRRRAYKGQSSVEWGTADPGGRVELSPKKECKCKKESEYVLKSYKTIWMYNILFLTAPQAKIFFGSFAPQAKNRDNEQSAAGEMFLNIHNSNN